MAANLLAVVNELARLKRLKKDVIREIIVESLENAINKKLDPENELEIIADFDNNTLITHFVKIVKKNDLRLGEISLEEARKTKPEAELGDAIPVRMEIQDYEPKIIENAKRSILSKIKKSNEDKVKIDFERQKNELVSGKVVREGYNGYIVNIGYTEALLPLEEQIEEEFFKPGDIIKAFVVDIRRRKKGIVVIISRTRPGFVKKLFEQEIPEVASGKVKIKKIVREPGIRTKVAVEAVEDSYDAVGSCLGPNGNRVKQIKKELHGEQIDIIDWDDSIEKLIINAVGKDLVETVYLAQHGKFGHVIVKKKNKNLAIGKQGKNVRLASTLTEYKLDIFTNEEFQEEKNRERRVTSHVSHLDGVTDKLADTLKNAGYTSVQDIFEASVTELTNLEGIGKKKAEKLVEASKSF